MISSITTSCRNLRFYFIFFCRIFRNIFVQCSEDSGPKWGLQNLKCLTLRNFFKYDWDKQLYKEYLHHYYVELIWFHALNEISKWKWFLHSPTQTSNKMLLNWPRKWIMFIITLRLEFWVVYFHVSWDFFFIYFCH